MVELEQNFIFQNEENRKEVMNHKKCFTLDETFKQNCRSWQFSAILNIKSCKSTTEVAPVYFQ